MHIIDVQFINHEWALVFLRIENQAAESVVTFCDVHRPCKAKLIKVKAENGIESSRGKVEHSLPDKNFMAVF
jgi:hypothetical protein